MHFKTLAFIGLAALLAGCSGDSPINGDLIGDAIGGQAGQLVKSGSKAGRHLLNVLALSPSDENALGQSVGVGLTHQYGLSRDDALQKYVNLVGLTVAGASAEPTANWVFGVLDTPEVNAFSGPHGYVFVTRGALTMMKDEAELAGVLAHEIAHITHHDGLKEIKDAEGKAAFGAAMEATGETQQFAQLADLGVDTLMKHAYSQPQEFAADKEGVQVVAAAGYDPASYIRFLQRLQQREGASAGGRLMSTHPGVGDRIGRISGQLQAMRPGGATLADRFAKNVRVAP